MRRGRASLPHPGVRGVAASERHRGPAWPLEQVWHREPASAILQPEARRDVRRAAVRQVCCRAPALRSAQVLSSVSPSEREWLPAQPRRASPQALRMKEGAGASASLWAQAWAAPRRPLEAAAEVSEPDGPWEAVSSARAAEPRREAVLAEWEPDVPQVVPEAVVSGRAAAGPRPEAATAASEQQAAAVVAAARGVPQGEAVAEAALQGAAVRQPAEARAGGAAQPRAAVRPGVRALQAARPQAVPSAAASVFRQGPSLAAGPARPRAARLAHAMRCLPIASR
ncbi:hypothetical protein SAMN04487925_108153 [Bradyrhizobium sp. cf659]|nr:hypothetical protein SAMN04487925_108153 [Bradyrhizobium sp. cf659]